MQEPVGDVRGGERDVDLRTDLSSSNKVIIVYVHVQPAMVKKIQSRDNNVCDDQRNLLVRMMIDIANARGVY